MAPGRTIGLRSAGIVSVALIASTVFAACGGGDSEESTTTGSTAAAVQPLPEATSSPEILDAGGHYETTIFEPRIALTLPDGDWETAAPQTADSFGIRHYLSPGHDAILAVVKIDQVFDPQRGGSSPADALPAPEDFTQFLVDHPRLKTSTPESATAIGLPGQRVDAEVISTPPRTPTSTCGQKACLPLYLDNGEPVVYGKGDQLRYYILDGPDGQLIAELYVSAGTDFDAQVPALEDALASYELAD